MKKLIVLVVVMMLVVMAGSAMAGTTTGNMLATASVAATCSITGVTPLAFGALTGVAATATSVVSYKCSNTLPATVSLGATTSGSYAGSMLGAVSSTNLAYSATPAAWSVTGNGNAQTLNIDGAISAANAAAAVADTYSETVVVTFTF